MNIISAVKLRHGLLWPTSRIQWAKFWLRTLVWSLLLLIAIVAAAHAKSAGEEKLAMADKMFTSVEAISDTMAVKEFGAPCSLPSDYVNHKCIDDDVAIPHWGKHSVSN
ncbi:MAG TPA: hypothetical protein VFM18_06315 [Methanosarcina sp.]|nr:hypothetical protein [Methanosarcina sp.]